MRKQPEKWLVFSSCIAVIGSRYGINAHNHTRTSTEWFLSCTSSMLIVVLFLLLCAQSRCTFSAIIIFIIIGVVRAFEWFKLGNEEHMLFAVLNASYEIDIFNANALGKMNSPASICIVPTKKVARRYPNEDICNFWAYFIDVTGGSSNLFEYIFVWMCVRCSHFRFCICCRSSLLLIV